MFSIAKAQERVHVLVHFGPPAPQKKGEAGVAVGTVVDSEGHRVPFIFGKHQASRISLYGEWGLAVFPFYV